MDDWRMGAISKQPLLGHGIFAALWMLLLILGALLYDGANWPAALAAGLLPILAGGAIFQFGPRQEAIRWSALLTGQALGVVLGSTLLAGPDSPLMLLVFWPAAWAALVLPPWPGLGVVGALGGIYLVVGLWRAVQSRQPGPALLGLTLYIAAIYALFILLRERERALARRPAAPAPPPPADPERDNTLYQDLRVARDIQVSLLLASSPRLPGWESSTAFLPAQELGGDLYDFVELDACKWGIMIGDVSGKGIPAALHMAVARTLFRMEARRQNEPAETLAQINRYLIEQAPQGCVTLLYAHLDTAGGTIRLANAGHNYPLLLNESVQEVALDGLPLGIDADYVFAETCTHMAPGDVLIFYTDGIVEAVNAQGDMFGFERLRQVLAANPLHRPRTLTRHIVRAVRAFTEGLPQSDDITLVVLRRRYEDRGREIVEVSLDVLGPEGSHMVHEFLQGMRLPADSSDEAWRAAILTLGSAVRDRWGQGPSRELTQQLFLTLEGL